MKNIDRNENLSADPAGAALVAFLDRHETHAQTARELGIAPTVIAQWVLRGRISRNGACLAEKRLGISKKSLRPDLTDDDWKLGTPGRAPGAAVSRDNHDQQTLTKLAAHFGSVRQFCSVAGITIGQFHSWLSRGRIAAWAIPRLLGMDVPEEIKARLLADPK